MAGYQNKAGCDALIAEIKKREHKLHILVNNSGITWGAPYDDFPEVKGWDNVMAVNVKSIFYSKDLISLTQMVQLLINIPHLRSDFWVGLKIVYGPKAGLTFRVWLVLRNFSPKILMH